MTAHRQRTPVCATALGVVFLAVQWSGFMHRLEVQHAVCAEHGEAVHVSGRPATATASGPLLDPVPGAGLDGHDHCAWAFAGRGEIPVGSVVRAVPAATGSPPVGWSQRHAPPPQVRPLELAPKASPPGEG